MQEVLYEGIAGLLPVTSLVSLFVPRQQKGHSSEALRDDGPVASEMRLGSSL